MIDKKSLNKFSGKSIVYSLYRPKYSNEIINYIINRMGNNFLVADIGCGTGIFTKQLLDNNIEVIGIEPNHEMFNQAKIYLKKYNCKIINSCAENTTLKNNSIDLITVAQALHRFIIDKFIVECKRILKKNGKVAIIYNNMNKGNPIVDDFLNIHRELCPNYRGGFNKLQELYNYMFETGYEIYNYENNQEFDYKQYIGYTKSLSYSLQYGNLYYDKYLEMLDNLFFRYSISKKIIFPMTSSILFGKLK